MIIYLNSQSILIVFISSKVFMKKYAKFLWILALTCCLSLWLQSNAEYEIQIDEENNEVYLLSWDTQITLDNIDDYAADLNKNLNLWLEIESNWTWDTVESTELIENWTDSTIEWSGSIVSGNETWSWDTIEVQETTTWSETRTRTLGENVDAELLTGTEFEQALYRMYKNGLTKYDNEEEYRPNDNLTREESAKMIGQLYSQMGFDTEIDKWLNCNFVDTNIFNPTLSEHIYNSCKRWIFRGNDKTQQYMPRDNLTKGQLLAVLLRIFEGKMSDESWQPRWIEYYVKGVTLWLTNEINLDKFNQPVSRREAALLIYRFKNMVIDEIEYKLYLVRLEWVDYLQQIEEIKSKRTWSDNSTSTTQVTDPSNPDSNWITAATWSTTSGTSATSSNISLDIIAGNETLTNSPEFIEAINWMHDMWMTNYNTTEAFMPYQTITRAQVAKMIDKFATATSLTTIRNFWNCEFSDVDSWSEYKDAITRVCQYWVMAWSNDKFSPDKTVTKAEFVAMLIRLFDGKTLDETLSPRWTSYYKRAVEIGLIWAQDTVTFTSDIARYDVAIYLYRLKVRLTMYNNLNSNQLSNELVRTIPETISTEPVDTEEGTGSIATGDNITTNENVKVSAKVFVDILALNNSAFTDWYIEILWERYRIKKSSLDTYNVWSNSFVRYGTLYSIESWDTIGSTSFITTNWDLVEWSIRINQNSYYLSKDSNTTTYYNLIQK